MWFFLVIEVLELPPAPLPRVESTIKLLSLNYYNKSKYSNSFSEDSLNNLFIIKFHFREIKVPSKTYTCKTHRS